MSSGYFLEAHESLEYTEPTTEPALELAAAALMEAAVGRLYSFLLGDLWCWWWCCPALLIEAMFW